MKVAILTAIFGDYEELKPAVPQDGCDAEFICVTDRLDRPRNGWTLVQDRCTSDLPPLLMAKLPKMLPWNFTEAEATVWLDASFRVTSRSMAADMIARAHPIAQFLHPDRECIYDEASFSATLERYKSLPLVKQIASYAGEHPRLWGLWAAGVIARRRTDAVVYMGEQWMQQCHRWGAQDQVSQAPCLRAAGLRPASLPGSLYNNRWFSFEPSSKHLEARK